MMRRWQLCGCSEGLLWVTGYSEPKTQGMRFKAPKPCILDPLKCLASYCPREVHPFGVAPILARLSGCAGERP